MVEIWKPVLGYEGLYEVSNIGSVKSLERYVPNNKGSKKLVYEKILNHCEVNGYDRVELSKDGKRKMHRVHRLVAQAFIPNPNNLPQVNHKDENKKNNCVENLEWCTCVENQNHGTRNTRCAKARRKRVQAIGKNGDVVMEFNSITEASKVTGARANGISACINGRNKTSGGYIWKEKLEV